MRVGIGIAGNQLLNGGQPEGTLVGYREDGSKIFVSQPSDWDGIISAAPTFVGIHAGPDGQVTSDWFGPNEPIIERAREIFTEPSAFDKFIDSLGKAAISASNYIGPVAFAAVDRVDFNQTVVNNGLSQTLNDNLYTVFDRPTIENIMQQGGIDNILAAGTTPITLPDGTAANSYHFSNTTDLIFDDSGNFVGQFKNGSYEIGDFTVSNQEFVLNNGTRYTDFGNGVRTEMIFQDGQIQQISMYEDAVDPRLIIESIDDKPIFIKGPDGDLALGGDFEMSIDNLTYVVINGKVSSAKVKTGDGQGSSGGSSSASDDLLYLLVNGINNTDLAIGSGINIKPDYYLALRDDLHAIDNNISTTDDVAIASIYPNLKLPEKLKFAEKALNRFKDVLLMQAEANVPFAPLLVVADIVAQTGSYDINRPVYGLGYSGGFAPMLEAMNAMGMKTQMIAGVGAATVNLANVRDVLNLLVNSIFALENERILNQNGGDFVKKAKSIISTVYDYTLGLIPVIGPLFKSAVEFLLGGVQQTIDWVADAVHLMIDMFGKTLEATRIQWLLEKQDLFGLSDVDGADGVLNIFGDRDLLVDLGIAGKMSNIAGYSGDRVLDIEIKSYTDPSGLEAVADHYIYMREIRDYNDIDGVAQRELQQQFDLNVANFVSHLLVAGTDMAKAQAFLSQFPGVIFNPDSGSYEFYPFGVPQP